MSRKRVTGTEPALADLVSYLQRQHNIDPADIRRLVASAEIGSPMTLTVTMFINDPTKITESAPAMVNVPVLKYGDRCEAHGYDTYVLDGVTFHRATLGVCTDTSAPPRAWKPNDPVPDAVFGVDADGHHAIDGCLWPHTVCSGHVVVG